MPINSQPLGAPLPDSPFAASVSMPSWGSVVGYEEGDPQVVNALQAGYPRFVLNRYVANLISRVEQLFAEPGEQCFVWPSQNVAQRAVAYLTEQTGLSSRILPLGCRGIYAQCAASAGFATMKQFWQHCGEIVSSRQAAAVLRELAEDEAQEPFKPSESNGACAKAQIRQQIAELLGAAPGDVFLYPSGMAGISHVQRVLSEQNPQRKAALVGFSYIDTIKLLERFGAGMEFIEANESGKQQLAELLAMKSISAVYCEFPSNPLLQSVDLQFLSQSTRAHGVPLVVDETIGGFINVDLLSHVDFLCTSLTKFFSGGGDVLAGSVVVNAGSELVDNLRRAFEDDFEDLFWQGDAQCLARNCQDFAARLKQINASAEILCEELSKHPAVERIYYPKFETPENYLRYRRPNGGFGGLFSLLLRDAHNKAEVFYDTLNVAKGPGLGTNFTLACPYTLLAHYHELPWAESLGVSRYLVRVSVGLEPVEEIISRFREALDRVI